MPSDPYVGTWGGTLADQANGDGIWELALRRTASLSGSGLVRIGANNTAGSAAELPPPPGSVGRFISLSCAATGGGALVMNVTVSGDTIDGTYQSLGCVGFTAGTVSGRRR